MFWKKDKPEVVFECDNWATRKYSPIRPAAEFVPEKFNNLPAILKKEEHVRDNMYSVKICPGLQDYIDTDMLFLLGAIWNLKLIATIIPI
jgi:hypothetical protein